MRRLSLLAPASPVSSPSSRTKGAGGEEESTVRFCTWGWNVAGQLGHGGRLTTIRPTCVVHRLLCSAGNPVYKVSVGSRFTCVLLRSGTIFTWGRGDDGQLGHGDFSGQLAPRLVEALAQATLIDVATRCSHVLALSETGNVYSWGRGEEGQLGYHGLGRRSSNTPKTVEALRGVPVTAVSCGRTMSLAVSSSRRQLFAWGSGDDGNLGLGASVLESTRPEVVPIFEGVVVKSIACGSRHVLVATERNHVYSWGWGIFGQLGLGDTANREEPTQVLALAGMHVVRVECGFRHSFAVVRTKDCHDHVYAWGWNQHGQLGISNAELELNSRVVLLPHRVSLPAGNAGHSVVDICGGGRHSLVVIKALDPLNSSSKRKAAVPQEVWAWGCGDDGQLGLADVASRSVPTLLHTMPSKSRAIALGAGWAHSSAILIDTTGLQLSDDAVGSLELRHLLSLSAPVMGDLDGLMSQCLGCLTQYMLALKVLPKITGMDESFVLSTIIPSMGFAMFIGNLVFGIQGVRLALKEDRADVTAQIHGIAIVLFYAYANGVMAPAYAQTLESCVTDGSADAECKAAAQRAAWRAGVFANFATGLLQLCAAPFAQKLRSVVPREALLSVVAGVALTFISLNFVFEVYSSPSYAVFPTLFMVICSCAQIRLPLNLPAGFISLLIGTLFAWIAVHFGVVDGSLDDLRSIAKASGESSSSSVLGLYLPQLHLTVLWEGICTGFRYLRVIFPMFLLNFGTNLADIEAAASVGDNFDVSWSIFADAVVSILSSMCGNPFSTQIFIGQPAFKAMGVRTSYAFMTAFVTALFAFTGCMALILQVIPIAAGVGFLMWIGVLVTKGAFDADPSQLVEHNVAVVVGLMPPLASWALSLVTTTYNMCKVSLQESGASESVSLVPVMNHLSKNGVFVYGMMSLSQGYLLSSIMLASTLVFALDRRFLRAALWLLVAALCSLFGVVHAFRVDEGDRVQPMLGGVLLGFRYVLEQDRGGAILCAVAYAAAALLCVLLHLQETVEQNDATPVLVAPPKVSSLVRTISTGSATKPEIEEPLLSA